MHTHHLLAYSALFSPPHTGRGRRGRGGDTPVISLCQRGGKISCSWALSLNQSQTMRNMFLSTCMNNMYYASAVCHVSRKRLWKENALCHLSLWGRCHCALLLHTLLHTHLCQYNHFLHVIFLCYTSVSGREMRICRRGGGNGSSLHLSLCACSHHVNVSFMPFLYVFSQKRRKENSCIEKGEKERYNACHSHVSLAWKWPVVLYTKYLNLKKKEGENILHFTQHFHKLIYSLFLSHI